MYNSGDVDICILACRLRMPKELTKYGVSVTRLLSEGKSITLARAMEDWHYFCVSNGIEGTIHDNAWTDTRLGMQKISAYDIYEMLDRIKLGLIDGHRRGSEQDKQKLLK